jgi:hypothetical protein
MMEPDEPTDEDEDAEDLCNCKFTLAYGAFQRFFPATLTQE